MTVAMILQCCPSVTQDWVEQVPEGQSHLSPKLILVLYTFLYWFQVKTKLFSFPWKHTMSHFKGEWCFHVRTMGRKMCIFLKKENYFKRIICSFLENVTRCRCIIRCLKMGWDIGSRTEWEICVFQTLTLLTVVFTITSKPIVETLPHCVCLKSRDMINWTFFFYMWWSFIETLFGIIKINNNSSRFIV